MEIPNPIYKLFYAAVLAEYIKLLRPNRQEEVENLKSYLVWFEKVPGSTKQHLIEAEFSPINVKPKYFYNKFREAENESQANPIIKDDIFYRACEKLLKLVPPVQLTEWKALEPTQRCAVMLQVFLESYDPLKFNSYPELRVYDRLHGKFLEKNGIAVRQLLSDDHAQIKKLPRATQNNVNKEGSRSLIEEVNEVDAILEFVRTFFAEIIKDNKLNFEDFCHNILFERQKTTKNEDDIGNIGKGIDTSDVSVFDVVCYDSVTKKGNQFKTAKCKLFYTEDKPVYKNRELEELNRLTVGELNSAITAIKKLNDDLRFLSTNARHDWLSDLNLLELLSEKNTSLIFSRAVISASDADIRKVFPIQYFKRTAILIELTLIRISNTDWKITKIEQITTGSY